MGFSDSSDSKESACIAGGTGLIPGEGNGNPLQYSCLDNSTDRGDWQATVHGVAKSRTRLSYFTFFHLQCKRIPCSHTLSSIYV